MNTALPDPRTTPEHPDWKSLRQLKVFVLLGATGAGVYLCYLLAAPFWPALTWALTLAVMISPLQRRLESKLKHPGLAAIVSVLVVGAVVIITGTFVGGQLLEEAGKGAEVFQAKIESGEWRHALEPHPRLVPLADWLERQNVPATVKGIAVWMTTTGASFIKGSVVEMMGFLLTFYLLFFLLRDRRAAFELLRSLSPLSNAEMDGLFRRVTDTIYATVCGVMIVAAVQGLLGGLMFWWLGLPSPLLWGVVMGLLAVVPVLGAYIVWVPTAIFLALEGSWGHALILTLWGGGVVGTVDNLLRPFLVGRKLKLHTIFAFMSVVGGLILFGPAGLILGPVVLTVTTFLLEVWRCRAKAITTGVNTP